MTEVLTTLSKPTKISIGVKAPKKVAEALSSALSATYRLMIETHITHWNVEGPLFYSVHMLTETQYNELFGATDVLAERMRSLGALTPLGVQSLVGKGTDVKPEAREMVEALIAGHEELARQMHDLAEVAEGEKDIVTADLATARSAVHEKAAWMLRSIAA
jgi:starvation-inducible DNA-binding protein